MSVNRFLWSAILGTQFFLLSYLEADDLHKIKEFEATFRRAHAKSNLEQLGSLVSWGDADIGTQNGMYRQLATGFGYVIKRFDLEPFKETTGPLSSPWWSVKPMGQFVVWCADEVDQPSFPLRYPIGRDKTGNFKFAIRVKHPTNPEWNVSRSLPKPIHPADDPSLQRLMSEQLKVVDRIEDVDPDVFQLLRAKTGMHARWAQHDEPFQVSDVPSPGDETLPDRRFVLAGHDGDLWFIKYVHGGFSPYGMLVIFLRAGYEWKIVFTAEGETEGNSLHSIQDGIDSGRYFRGGEL